MIPFTRWMGTPIFYRAESQVHIAAVLSSNCATLEIPKVDLHVRGQRSRLRQGRVAHGCGCVPAHADAVARPPRRIESVLGIGGAASSNFNYERDIAGTLPSNTNP